MITNDVLYVDIETNGLLPEVTRIHCINTRYGGSEDSRHWHGDPTLLRRDGGIVDGLMYIQEMHLRGSIIIYHNGEGYDLPVIAKLYPDFKHPHIKDTLALSRILYPERSSHSLESWGEELGCAKVEHEDWSRLTDDMLTRCSGDTELLQRLFEYLMKNKDINSAAITDNLQSYPLDSEQKVMRIHEKQVAKGVRFDVCKAARLYAELSTKRDTLKEHIVSTAPWSCLVPNVAKMNQTTWRVEQLNLLKSTSGSDSGVKPFKLNGAYTVNTKNYFGDTVETVGGRYSKVSFSPLNLNSSADVKTFLLTLGWKPTEWNYTFTPEHGKQKTSPKLTEDSYSSLPSGLGADIAKHNILKHRCNILFNPSDTGDPEKHKGALAVVAQKRGDGRVSADAITCGTPTARYKHRGVVCNIPRPGTPYGQEIRELFCVAEEHWMLGVDLSGIEARMLAHYIMPFTGGPELAKVIVDEDYHMYNTLAWFPECRNDDKALAFHRNAHSKGGLYALKQQRI